MKYNKKKFPRFYEYKMLGGSCSKEGRAYWIQYWKELNIESGDFLVLYDLRQKLGGNEKIHMFADGDSLRS